MNSIDVIYMGRPSQCDNESTRTAKFTRTPARTIYVSVVEIQAAKGKSIIEVARCLISQLQSKQ